MMYFDSLVLEQSEKNPDGVLKSLYCRMVDEDVVKPKQDMRSQVFRHNRTYRLLTVRYGVCRAVEDTPRYVQTIQCGELFTLLAVSV